MMAGSRIARMGWVAGAVLCLFGAVGCDQFELGKPVILFDRVPPGMAGGPNKITEIRGHVNGARPGDRIVIYALSDFWWVQPKKSQPFTTVDTDGNWSASTHLGYQYAALLVDANFHPQPVLQVLPSRGQGLRAISTSKGEKVTTEPVPSGKPFEFSGYTWDPRTIAGDRGGIMREYSPENISVDGDGFLHLRATRKNDRWVCSEVALTRSLGYGTYLFEVKDVAGLEPAADLEMFTWSSLAVSQEHSEMDIDVGQRGDPASKNAEFVVQPYYIAPNVFRYNAPAGLLTYSFDWEPESVSFMTSVGSAGPGKRKAVGSHVFTTSIPVPTEETAHINFCAYGYSKVPMQRDAEVVIEKFQYLP